MIDDERTITVTFNPKTEKVGDIVKRFRQELDAILHEGHMTHQERRERRRAAEEAALSGTETYAEIAARFGVAKSTVKEWAAGARYRRDRGIEL